MASALSGYPVSAGSMHPGQGASAVSSLPAAVRDTVGAAVIHGFHDTILILAGLSLVGLALALFLKDNRTKEAPVSLSVGCQDPCSQ